MPPLRLRHRSARAAAALAGALVCAAQAQPAPATGEHAVSASPAAAASAPASASTPVGGASAPTAAVARPPDLRELWAAFQKAGVKESEVALLAQPLAAGSPLLASHNEKLAFTLASTTKVITTLASLQTLPGSFRWRTRAWLTGTPQDGQLAGDLILVGGGDATLNSQRLVAWFKRLNAQGLRDVRGHIVLDQRLFRLSEKDHARTPSPTDANPHHAWPDALVVDDSRFKVTLRAAESGALTAQFDPPLGQVEVVNRLGGGARCAAQLALEPVAAAPSYAPAPTPTPAAKPAATPAKPSASDAAVAPDPVVLPAAAASQPAVGAASAVATAASGAAPAASTASAPKQTTAAAPAPQPIPPVARVVVSGQWSPRCTTPLTLEAVPSRALSAALVAGAWQASGGTLGAQVVHRDGAAPAPAARRARQPATPYPGKPWATLDSAPLPELVRAINKDSNNLMARNLLLSIAPGFSPTTSTLQLAKQRLGQWFKKVGLAQGAPTVDNGSGLAHSEQGSVLSMVQLLQTAWADPKVQKVFLASLPVAGADGTLAGRFKGSPAQRNAFLKTGTLNGVRSLAGYVRTQSGRMVAVSIVVNSDNASAAVPVMDRFIEWVVRNG